MKGANTGTFEQGEGPGSRQGARKDGSQTSNRACRRQLTGNIRQSNVRGNKSRWLLETGDKSEVLKSAHPGTTFQNGVNQDSQRPLTQGRLDDQIGSQGRLPVCPAILPSQEVCGLSLERPAVEIHVPPFWSEQCTFHIYKTNELNSSNLEKAGYQTHPVSRRHAGHGSSEGAR